MKCSFFFFFEMKCSIGNFHYIFVKTRCKNRHFLSNSLHYTFIFNIVWWCSGFPLPKMSPIIQFTHCFRNAAYIGYSYFSSFGVCFILFSSKKQGDFHDLASLLDGFNIDLLLEWKPNLIDQVKSHERRGI